MKSRKSGREFVLFLIFIVATACATVQAATYNGVCVKAKKSTILDILEYSCHVDSDGICRGTVTLSEAAINGYCDTAESGTCTETTGGILLGSTTVNCRKVADLVYGTIFYCGYDLTCPPQTFSTTTLVYVPSCQ